MTESPKWTESDTRKLIDLKHGEKYIDNCKKQKESQSKSIDFGMILVKNLSKKYHLQKSRVYTIYF